MAPFGWTSPYSSVTEYTALPKFTPEPVSVIVPEIVSGTTLPFAGHNTVGAAESVITGGVVSKKGPLYNSTPTSSLKKLVAIKSGLLSPFTSATTTEVAVSPPDP
jgi:hypothetical protein